MYRYLHQRFLKPWIQIENKINDTIEPRPTFQINKKIEEGFEIIEINIKKGYVTPYFYKGVAYQRQNTSTVMVDKSKLLDLMLKGHNLTYDQMTSLDENLSFKTLENKLTIVKKSKNSILIY